MTGPADREAAVLAVLEAARGRVVARDELARAAGLQGLSRRRVDGVLVGLRRVLPVGALVSVRRRGWALVPPRTCTDSERRGNVGVTPAEPPLPTVRDTPPSSGSRRTR